MMQGHPPVIVEKGQSLFHIRARTVNPHGPGPFCW